MKAFHQGQLDFFCAIYALINALKLTGEADLTLARLILAESLREISRRPLLWEALLTNQTDYYWLLDWLFGEFGRRSGFEFRVGRLPEAPLKAADRKSMRAGAVHKDPGTEEAGPRGLYGLTDEELCAWIGLRRPEKRSLDDFGPEDLFLRPPAGSSPLREFRWDIQELWPLLQNWLPVRSLFGSFNQEKGFRRCLILRFHRYLYASHPPLISHWTTGREFSRDTLLLFDCTADKNAIHSLPVRECALAELQLAPDRLLRIEPESIFLLKRFRDTRPGRDSSGRAGH